MGAQEIEMEIYVEQMENEELNSIFEDNRKPH